MCLLNTLQPFYDVNQMTNVANTQAIWATTRAQELYFTFNCMKNHRNNAWRTFEQNNNWHRCCFSRRFTALHYVHATFDGKQGGKSKWQAKQPIKFRRFYDTHNICGYVDDIFRENLFLQLMRNVRYRDSINFIVWLEPDDQNIRKIRIVFNTKNVKLQNDEENENRIQKKN